MKRYALILLILFFGISQSVQGVHFHFCSNQLAAVDFINLDDATAKTCGGCSKAKSCCSDVVQLFQHDAYHYTVSGVEVKAPLSLLVLISLEFPYSSICEARTSYHYSDPVSDGDIPIYILHRQFRL